MDLIYEGITTGLRLLSLLRHRQLSQNGPDLRRDYDYFFGGLYFSFDFVRMDLIYEGITTSWMYPIASLFWSEWTWFTKGLRPFYSFLFVSLWLSEWTWFTKGLRLYSLPSVLELELIPSQNGPDLRRDYDPAGAKGYRGTSSSEWTWFTKGLRR